MIQLARRSAVTWPCKDGAWIYIFFLSTPTLKKGLPLFGFEWGSEMFPPERYCVFRESPAGDLVEQAVKDYCANHTAAEAEKELNENAITAQTVLSYDMMPDHPHFKARGTYIEWDAIEGGKVKGPAPAPRFKNFPAQIWRRAPHYGEDNEAVLADLGYTAEQIKEMYDKGLIKQDLDDVRIIKENMAKNGYRILHD
jgi:L-carnitine CoA-transferase